MTCWTTTGAREQFGPRLQPGLYRLEGLELAAGFVFGRIDREIRPPTAATAADAKQALSDAIREIMADGRPCFVTFSGGRDSSVVLALAAHVARAEGLPLPVPITRRYPGIAEAEESEFQEVVVRHLKLDTWIRLDVGSDVDLLSPVAQESLIRRGVLWPPAVHRDPPLFRLATGGHLMTGEGGDNVFDPRRITALRNLAFERRRPSARLVVGAASALTPTWIQVRCRRRDDESLSWVRPEPRREILRLQDAQEVEPLRWDRAMISDVSSRAMVQGLETLSIVARQEGCELHHPLLDRNFVATVAAVGGRWGRRSRNEFMRLVFGDLLPDAVLQRTTKATFNTASFREHSREFVERWEGQGLDDDLIDSNELHRLWRKSFVSAATFGLLHKSWLCTYRSQNSLR